ncbi:ATP-binding protein [Kineococcus sp. G2]|uniref:ATP-binding protein n=1 Tax=Kineococcus sp. G2 TaxID=3127484 RepID=UPI00301CA203
MVDDDGALRLPAETGSAARARHHVRRTLGGQVDDDVVADAEVCASELVTNAVLHAGGPLLLTVRHLGPVVRLALADPSPVLPQWVPRSLTATTGRGLPLLTALSVARGADTRGEDEGGGKTVWCELSTTPADADEGADDDSALAAEWASVLADLGEEPPAPVAPGDEPPVRLLRYPLRRGVRLREHREAVLRELRLMGLAHAFPDPGTAGLAGEVTGMLDAEYGGHLNAAETRKVAALAAGLEHVDLEYARHPGHLELVRRWRSRMAEVDRLGRAAELLTTGEPPDVAELAAWIVEEFERQLSGGEPRPWSGPLD